MNGLRVAPTVALAFAAALGAADAPAQQQQQQQPARPAQPAWPTIDAVDPAELALLRPVLAHGAVILPRRIDHGTAARPTIFVRVRAPMATVHRVVATPEEYPTFMPALGGVEVLSRHGRQVAFRFHASAAVVSLTADATLHAVSARRIDVNVHRSDFGTSGSRWEFFPDGEGATILALTTWTDPSQSNWIVRQFASNSRYSTSSSSIAIETALALSVRRRAENLAGARLPVRPSRALAASPTYTPLPAGPWLRLAHPPDQVNAVVIRCDDEGAVTQVTSVGWTAVAPSVMAHRLFDIPQYHVFWPWVRATSELARTPDSLRFRVQLGAPYNNVDGEMVTSWTPGASVMRLDGVAGAFAGETRRFDFVPAPEGGNYVMYTSASDAGHAPWIQRLLMDRDPWVSAGITAYWNVVVMRYGLSGLYY